MKSCGLKNETKNKTARNVVATINETVSFLPAGAEGSQALISPAGVYFGGFMSDLKKFLRRVKKNGAVVSVNGYAGCNTASIPGVTTSDGIGGYLPATIRVMYTVRGATGIRTEIFNG